MKYPLVGLCIAFSLGIVSAAYLKFPFTASYLLSILFLVLSVIFLKATKKFSAFLLCAVFFLGAALLENTRILPACHISRFTPYKGETVYISGIVDTDPVYGKRNTSFVLKAERLKSDGWRDTSGMVLVKVFREEGFSYGERLLLEGKLYRPFFSSGRFNYRDYLRRRGIYAILSVGEKNTVERKGREIANPLKYFAFLAKHKAQDIITKNQSPLSASVLEAVILGERKSLPSSVMDDLVKTGTVHIISISGLHIVIVLFIVLTVLKVLRFTASLQYGLAILFLIAYSVLTGASTPVIRSTIMSIAFLLGYFFKRELNVYNSLSLAALIILTANPWQIFEISFQLSFLSILSIALMAPRIMSDFPETLSKRGWGRFLTSAFSVSFAAWVGLMPIIACYFGIISPVTVIANLIIVPYMTLVVASGFVLLAAGALAPPLLPVFAASAQFLVLMLFKMNSFLVSIPGAWFEFSGAPPIMIIFYYVALVLVFNFPKMRRVV